jgi:hypothetical protein
MFILEVSTESIVVKTLPIASGDYATNEFRGQELSHKNLLLQTLAKELDRKTLS